MRSGSHTALATSGSPELGDPEFQVLRNVIQSETGIQMKEVKRSLVSGRLQKRLHALGLQSFGEYCELLQGPAGKGELRQMVNCITTNKTSFFREDAHFSILRGWLQEMAVHARGRSLRIWCGACSTGEEPYSIAITAWEALGNAASFRILASDIDTDVLQTAEKGIYPALSLAPVPLDYRKRYFFRGVGEWDGYARVKPELRSPLQFQQLNLIRRPWNITGRFHAIFLRNVVIYFDRETQRGIFENLAGFLEPDGLLFVGSSESLFWLPELFLPVSHAVYRLNHNVRGGA